jgi:hypothetical protein
MAIVAGEYDLITPTAVADTDFKWYKFADSAGVDIVWQNADAVMEYALFKEDDATLAAYVTWTGTADNTGSYSTNKTDWAPTATSNVF